MITVQVTGLQKVEGQSWPNILLQLIVVVKEEKDIMTAVDKWYQSEKELNSESYKTLEKLTQWAIHPTEDLDEVYLVMEQ